MKHFFCSDAPSWRRRKAPVPHASHDTDASAPRDRDMQLRLKLLANVTTFQICASVLTSSSELIAMRLIPTVLTRVRVIAAEMAGHSDDDLL